mmetsp:Transcript_11149/g.22224  ORF Transcript_11149/g.22224 Transcript_11149/m.22224 type:complete len:107 (-) Transcript_11149:18-338(-)
MGLFGCVQKTVAVGIPLLQAMFDGDDRLGMYSLPLLVWHPSQLVLGSLMVPHLKAWVHKQASAGAQDSGAEAQEQKIEGGVSCLHDTPSGSGSVKDDGDGEENSKL